MFYQTRDERISGIDFCIKRQIEIKTVVEKVFFNRKDAEDYRDKINNVNDLIDEM
ncbi:MAG: hypothetical protein ABI208_06815 [Ginsengibacter sp.]